MIHEFPLNDLFVSKVEGSKKIRIHKGGKTLTLSAPEAEFVACVLRQNPPRDMPDSQFTPLQTPGFAKGENLASFAGELRIAAPDQAELTIQARSKALMLALETRHKEKDAVDVVRDAKQFVDFIFGDRSRPPSTERFGS